MANADLGVLFARLQIDSTSLDTTAAKAGAFGGILDKAFIGGSLAVAGFAAVSVKMAADFQNVTTTLVTGAGESVKNIDMIRQGILALAPVVGTAPVDLAKGLYMIESAGFHGAAALDILKISAEGAKVGLADQATVANALTTAMNAYHLPASSAVQVMNDLTAAVSLGKTHMQDLAASLGTILPVAAALGIPLVQITAGMATMTVQGTNAATAATSLRFLLSALAGPTKAAATELGALGLSASQAAGFTAGTTAAISAMGLHTSAVAATLAGPGGLPAALKMITDALAKEFPLYKTNAGEAAAYEAALKGAVGGTRGMTAALELTGANMTTFTGNIQAITGAVTTAGNAVSGWALIQGDFTTKMDQAKAALDVFMIRIGTALLPILSSVADWFTNTVLPALTRFSDWFSATAVPALENFGRIIGNVLGVVMPPLVAVFGFFANNLWLVEGALAAVVTRMLVLKTIALEQTIVGWVTSLGTYVGGLTAAGAAAQAEAAVAVAAAGEVTVATDAMAVGGEGAFALMGLSASGLVLGIAAIGAAAFLVATHWTEVTSIFQTQSQKVAAAVKQVDDNWNAMTAKAATSAVTGITNNLAGYKTALLGVATAINSNYAPAMATLEANTFAAQQKMAAANTVIATTTTTVASAAYRVAQGATAIKDAAIVNSAAAAETIKKNQSLSTSLFDLTSNYSHLAPVVQTTVNQLLQYDATGRLATQAYQALKGVQDQGLPTWSATGLITGVVTVATDQYRNKLIQLAGQVGAMQPVYKGLLAAYDAAGGGIARQVAGITGALPYYQTLIQSYTDQATANGLTGKAALAWATQQANTIDPAGKNAASTMLALATSMGLTGPGAGAAIQALVNQNPSLLAAFLQQRADAANTALILAGLAGAWNTLTKAEQAAMLAAQLARNAAALVPGQTRGILAEGGIVNAPPSGEPWTLHGTEAVVPKAKASPALWQAMTDALSGKPPSLSPAMSAGGGGSVPTGGGSMGSASINQSFHIYGGDVAQIQAVVRRENATLVTALRAGRR